RSRIFFSASVKLPIPDLAILSRIGSTEAITSSGSTVRRAVDFCTTYSFGFGCNRSFKFVNHASSGPAPRNSIKRKANAVLAQRTTRSCQSCAASALKVQIAARITKIHFAGLRMNEGVGDQPPNLPMEPNLRAIEHRVIERASGTDRKKERGQDRTTDVETDKNCRDVDREPSHPGYRPIIIGGSDSEHASNRQPPISSRKRPSLRRKNPWRTARTGRNLSFALIKIDNA